MGINPALGVNRRVLIPINPDGKFARFVNGAHIVNCREYYSLMQPGKSRLGR